MKLSANAEKLLLALKAAESKVGPGREIKVIPVVMALFEGAPGIPESLGLAAIYELEGKRLIGYRYAPNAGINIPTVRLAVGPARKAIEAINRRELAKRYGEGKFSVGIDTGEVHALSDEWRYIGHIDNPKLFEGAA